MRRVLASLLAFTSFVKITVSTSHAMHMLVRLKGNQQRSICLLKFVVTNEEKRDRFFDKIATNYSNDQASEMMRDSKRVKMSH